jgi:hypothetical protein
LQGIYLTLTTQLKTLEKKDSLTNIYIVSYIIANKQNEEHIPVKFINKKVASNDQDPHNDP